MKIFSLKNTIGAITLLLTSCASTNFISIDVMTPARVSFPSDVVNLVIVDNAATQTDDEGHVTIDFKRSVEANAASTDTAKIVFKEALTQFMNEENYFNKVSLYPHNTRTDNDYLRVSTLTKKELQDVRIEMNAEAVLSLDMFVTSTDMVLGLSIGHFVSMGYNELRGKIGISYRLFNKQGGLIAGPIVYVDSAFWNNQEQYIPHRNDALKEMALVAAEKITKDLIPYWEKQDRWYYSDGKSEMKAAAKLAKAGNWHDAALIWGELYEKEEKEQRKIKLASNIALANECLDDIENAGKWIDIADSLLPEKSEAEVPILTIMYKKILDTRKRNIPKLHKQLGDE